MRRNLLAVAAIAGLFLIAVAVIPQRVQARRSAPSVDLGRHLVTIAGCNDCHTPFKLGPNGPEPDMSRMLSGHPEEIVLVDGPPLPPEPWGFIGSATNTAWYGPWGISYTANLTPDQDTGMGIWTEEMFIQALRTGKHMGQSRPIQPPMPWQFYGKMTDHELRSVYAYLRTIPPIRNRVPDYRPPDMLGVTDSWSTH